MQIVDGIPTFGASDVVYRNDGQNAYDDKGNVMGAWGDVAAGNPLNTSQTSFLDFLKGNGTQGLGLGINDQTQAFGNPQSGISGVHHNESLSGGVSGLWGNASNPYYNYMLQLLTGGKTSFDVFNPGRQSGQSSGGITSLTANPISAQQTPDFNSYGDASPYAGGW